MYESFLNGVQQISPLNMNSTVVLFKALGRPSQATEMIQRYIASHAGNREFFNADAFTFFGDVPDPEVVLAFRHEYAKLKDKRTPAAILQSMASINGWNPDDIAALSSLCVEDYYRVFKNSRGDDLRKIINACLQFDRIQNATPDMKEVSGRAREALRRIGQESAINARRVKAYGVEAEGQRTKVRHSAAS